MVSETDKRAAALVLSRFRVDRDRLQEAALAAHRARAEGKNADLLDILVGQKILTSSQAHELRRALHVVPSEGTGPPLPQAPSPAQSVSGTDGEKKPDETVEGVGQEVSSLGGFRLLRPIGEGGMGAVYLGYQESKGRQVAIKILPDQLARNQSYIERFHREARSMALLDHPNIVHAIAVGRDQGSGKHYLVLEYVDGPSAHALLDRFGRLPVSDAVHIALDVARALEHAHSRNIIHRDIKPDNILLTKTGVAKLSDLGLARRTDESSHLTGVQQGFGTPFYMPYEQALNAKQADGRSDIYALGATLYHLVTGEVPFPGSSHLEVAEKKEIGDFVPASTINAAVPPALDAILDKMLARFPEDRYQTASELIVDLERSGLSAPVPSFVDPDLALQDPLVRARLTAPAQPTQTDLSSPIHQKPVGSPEAKTWYIRYRNREGRWSKGRATTRQVIELLRRGRLSSSAEASRQPNGRFRPLSAYPEFRKTAAVQGQRAKSSRNGQQQTEPEPAQRTEKADVAWIGKTNRKWVFAAGIGLLAALALLIGFLLLR